MSFFYKHVVCFLKDFINFIPDYPHTVFTQECKVGFIPPFLLRQNFLVRSSEYKMNSCEMNVADDA